MTISKPPAPQIRGAFTIARFSRVVAGDTIRVFLSDQEHDEPIHILNVSDCGIDAGVQLPSVLASEATGFANKFFADASEIILELPVKAASVDDAIEQYRGNFGRPHVYVYKDGRDYSEELIRRGLSPYCNKYGNAPFDNHHQRYMKAELDAQISGAGIWMEINGKYAALKAWWQLRANVIDEFRAVKEEGKDVFNACFNYADLFARATDGEDNVTVFTEARSIRVVETSVGLIDNGGEDRPFCLKVNDIHEEESRELVRLLQVRYMGTEEQPRRGYLYARGRLEMYRGAPHLVVHRATDVSDSYVEPQLQEVDAKALAVEAEGGNDAVENGVTDTRELSGSPAEANLSANGTTEGQAGLAHKVVEGRTDEASVFIAALLPNPRGADRGNETVTFRNLKDEEVDMSGWGLQDKAGRMEKLSISLPPKCEEIVTLTGDGVQLNNKGDSVTLVDANGAVMHMVTYVGRDVSPGRVLHFSNKFSERGSSPIEALTEQEPSADPVVEPVQDRSLEQVPEGAPDVKQAQEAEAETVLNSAAEEVTESAPGAVTGEAVPKADIYIAALLPNPHGADRGNETVTFGNVTDRLVDMSGWELHDKAGRSDKLSVALGPSSEETITLSGDGVQLNNSGDMVSLIDNKGVVRHVVMYNGPDVRPKKILHFSNEFSKSGTPPIKPVANQDPVPESAPKFTPEPTQDRALPDTTEQVRHAEQSQNTTPEPVQESTPEPEPKPEFAPEPELAPEPDPAQELEPVPEPAPAQQAVEEAVQTADVFMSALLPNPHGADRGHETITFRNTTLWGVDMTGWELKDKAGRTEKLNVRLGRRSEETVTLSGDGIILNNNGDMVTLLDDKGVIRHRVSYSGPEVRPGKVLHFENRFSKWGSYPTGTHPTWN